MPSVATDNVQLWDKNQQHASKIIIKPKPMGTSELFFFLPIFKIQPMFGEGAPPPVLTIELEVVILRPEIYKFGMSMSIGKRFLINSTDAKPIGFSIASLQDFEDLGEPLSVRFKTRVFHSGNNPIQRSFSFTTVYG